MSVKSGQATYTDNGTGTITVTNGDGTTAQITGLQDQFVKTVTLENDNKLKIARNDGHEFTVDLAKYAEKSREVVKAANGSEITVTPSSANAGDDNRTFTVDLSAAAKGKLNKAGTVVHAKQGSAITVNNTSNTDPANYEVDVQVDGTTVKVEGGKLSVGTITNNNIVDNTISGDKITNQTITGDKLVDNTITKKQINQQTVADFEAKSREEVIAGEGVDVTSNPTTTGADNRKFTVSVKKDFVKDQAKQAFKAGDNIVFADENGQTKVSVNPDLTGINSINAGGNTKVGDVVIGTQTATPNKGAAETGKYVTGLDNKDWNVADPSYVSGRAATEDQLKKVSDAMSKQVASKSDYRLIANPANNSGGKYKVDDKGEVNLTVQNLADPKQTETVTLSDIASKTEVDNKLDKTSIHEIKGAGLAKVDNANITTGDVTVTVNAADVQAEAKKAVKVVAGTHTTVTEATDGDAQTYAVNVTTNGSIAEGNKGIVTGETIYNEVHVPGLTGGKTYNVIASGNTVSQNLVALDERVGENTTNITKNAGDIKKNTTNITNNTKAIGKIGTVKVTGDAGLKISSTNKELKEGDVTIELNKSDIQKAAQETLKAGKNIVLDKDNATGETTIKTADDVNFTSVTTGDTVMNDNGLTINNGPSITKTGIDAGSKKITNVADGVDGSDAVNVSQLKDVKAIASKKSVETVTATQTAQDAGLTVAETSNQATDKVYEINLDKTKLITDIVNGKDGKPGAAGKPGADGTKTIIEKNIDLTYKANGGTKPADSKTTKLRDGLDFTNGTNTTAEIGDNGVVKFNLNKDITGMTNIGIDGKDGANGKDGAIGLSGKDGVTIKGNTGADGKQGEIGLRGTDGINGRNGKDVTAKIKVVTGTDGVDGVDGTDGRAGKNGNDGMTRIVYDNHEVATLDDGLIFAGNDEANVTRKLNQKLTITGEGVKKAASDAFSGAAGNINVKKSGDGGLQVQLADKLKNLKEVVIGTDATNADTVAMTETGINASSKAITNVKSSITTRNEADFDAQLKAAQTATPNNAVNVDDLAKATKSAKDFADQGFNIAANADANGLVAGAKNIKPTETLTVKGDGSLAWADSDAGKNITTQVSGDGEITIALAKSIDGIDKVTVGKDGKDGKPGKDGAIGVKGADGKSSVGINGKDGISVKGDKGEVGIKGNDGISIKGEKGKDGSIGLSGKDGISVKGKDGEDGVTIKGVDGKNGTNGEIGLNGHDGINGRNGKDVEAKISVMNGTDGVDGVDGTDARKSKAGKDGMTRIVYKDKDGTDHEVATMDDGLIFAGNDGQDVLRKLNQKLTIKGDSPDLTGFATAQNNINVVKDGDGGLLVQLANKLKNLEQVVLGTDPADANTVAMTKTGINAGSQAITNVKSSIDDKADKDFSEKLAKAVTDNPNNAVNVKDLADATKAATDHADKGLNFEGDNAGVVVNRKPGQTLKVTGGETDASKLSDNKNIGVVADANGELKVKLSKNINVEKVTTGTGDKAVTIDGTKGTITAGTGDNVVEVDGTKAKITAGTGDKAVTVDGTKAEVKAGKVTVDGDKGHVTGLTNKDWDVKNPTVVSGRAATEDQLKAVSDVAKGAADKANSALQGVTSKDKTVTIDNTDPTKPDLSVNIDNKTIVKDKTTGQLSVGEVSGDKITNNTITGDKIVDNSVTINKISDTAKGEITSDKGIASVKAGDENKLATVGNVKDALNKTGFNVQSGTNNAEFVKSGDTLKLNAGKNIEVEQKGAEFTFKTADEVEFTKVTAGDTVINKDGLTINNGPSITKTGIDAGNKVITNVAPGKISKDSTEAINGSQIYGIDAKATQAINIAGNVHNELGRLRNETNSGFALAGAFASLKPLQYRPYEKTQIMAGVGRYKGNTAFALGLAVHSNENLLINGGIGFARGNTLMVNAGITWRVGTDAEKELPEKLRQGPITAVYEMNKDLMKLEKTNQAMEEKYRTLEEDNAKLHKENEELKRKLELVMQHLGMK